MKARPVVVEYRWKAVTPGMESLMKDWDVWRKYKTYRTLDEAQKMIEQQERKQSYYEFRIRRNDEQCN